VKLAATLFLCATLAISPVLGAVAHAEDEKTSDDTAGGMAFFLEKGRVYDFSTALGGLATRAHSLVFPSLAELDPAQVPFVEVHGLRLAYCAVREGDGAYHMFSITGAADLGALTVRRLIAMACWEFGMEVPQRVLVVSPPQVYHIFWYLSGELHAKVLALVPPWKDPIRRLEITSDIEFIHLTNEEFMALMGGTSN
jgi:hypothetical protein